MASAECSNATFDVLPVSLGSNRPACLASANAGLRQIVCDCANAMPTRVLISRLNICLSAQEDALAKILSRLQPADLALTECTSRRFRRLGDRSNLQWYFGADCIPVFACTNLNCDTQSFQMVSGGNSCVTCVPTSPKLLPMWTQRQDIQATQVCIHHNIGFPDVCHVFCCHLTQSVFCLNAWHPKQIQANWMQPWLPTNTSRALQLLVQAMPCVNVPSHIVSQCKHFMAHCEIHTRRASIVSPDQPVLCMPVQMFTTQLMHQTSHACCPMQICQSSAGLTSAEAGPEAAAAQQAHLQSFFHKGLYREMLLAPSGDSTAICCYSCYCTPTCAPNVMLSVAAAQLLCMLQKSAQARPAHF